MAAAGVTALASLVGILGLDSLTGRLIDVTERSWPAADMCMEFWIGSLAKYRAGYRFLDGEEEAAQSELGWARAFTTHSLEKLRLSGTLPPATMEELARLNAEADEAMDAFIASARRERSLSQPGLDPSGSPAVSVPAARHDPPSIAAAREKRRAAAQDLNVAIQGIERAIAPLEETMDRSMDAAAAESLAVASRVRLQLILVAAAGLTGALIIGTLITSRIVRPLRRLTEMTRLLAAGLPTEPAHTGRQDEVGELASHFDRMAADIAASRASLRASEARYRTLFECARHGMVVFDGAGTIFEANTAFCEMAGRSRGDLVRGRFQDLLPPEGREALLERLNRLVDTRSQTGELELVRPDGSRVPLEGGGARLTDGRTVLSMRDVTERRRMEQALIQGEKLRAVGQLAAGVAHELRNPLFVISNVLYDLRETLASHSPSVVEQLEMANEENRRAREIIDNLLEFSRPADPGAHHVEPGTAVQQVLRVFREALMHGHIDLDLRLSDPLRCHFHPDAFKQVMINLVSNAMDAMPQGGRLTVATRGTPEGRVEVRVEDTGVGIAADHQKEIFNPFYSTKQTGRGTGLGLWIVHSAVARYQGRITVDSAEGHGTAFTLDLRGAGEAA